MRPVLSLFLDMNNKHTVKVEDKKYAVIYARYSSSAQTEQSIEGQLSVCYDYAEKNGYTIIREYIDRAISGRSDDRPDFLRMMDDAKKGGFQYVLVYKLDRFARNRYDSAIYKYQLKKSGVKVISCMENIGDNPESIILEAVLEASAEYYSIDLSQKVKRGRIESAKKGRFIGGGVPLGYKLENGTLQIDERTAAAVRYVFQEYAAGSRLQDIVDHLNNNGFRGARGGTFSKSSFWRMLSNEKYLGILDQEGYRFENAFPALIDKDTFERAQKRLESNRHLGAKNKADSPYVLTGKLFCGLCGQSMVGISGTGKSHKKWYYYSCNGKRKKICQKRHEKKDFIEWYVAEQTVQYILDPSRIHQIAAAVVEQYDKDFSQNEINALEKQIRAVEREINKILELMIEVPESVRPNLNKKLEDRSAKKDSLELELKKLKVARKVQLTEAQIVSWLKSFCHGNLFDMEFRERLIDTFINSVYLFDDKVVIYYNVDGSKQVSYIEMLEDIKEIPSPDADIEEGTPVRIPYDEVSQCVQNTNNPVMFFHKGVFGIILKRTS